MVKPKEYYQFEEHLKTSAKSWFAEKGYSTREERPDVLLTKKDWPKNIILPEVANYIRDTVSNKDIHTHANSGLSSQAMVFNLIGPLIIEDDLSPLKGAMELSEIDWPSGQASAIFEYEDHEILGEDPNRPTSVDVCIKDNEGLPFLFIEAKLRESGYGGCSHYKNKKCEGMNPAKELSRCYLHQIGRKYWEFMLDHGFHHGKIGEMEHCIFINHYQFFRNALIASQTNKTFVTLHDARSPIFRQNGKGLIPEILEILPEEIHNKIKSISIQQVVMAIKNSGRHEWIREFEKKYGLA